MSLRAGILVAAGLLAGMSCSADLYAQDGSMSWIDAARNAPSVSAPVVPVPDRRPRPPASSKARVTANVAPAATETTPETVVPEKKPADPGAQAAESPRTIKTSPTFAHEAVAARALGQEVAAQEARPESAPQTTAEKAGEITGSTAKTEAAKTASVTPPPARRPARPKPAAAPVPPQAAPARKKETVETAARQKKRAGQASAQDEKCEALGRCRDAFARCKAKFIKENGEWDLEKEPCGDKYKVCIRKTFAPGEMFFTRWFWPYEACP